MTWILAARRDRQVRRALLSSIAGSPMAVCRCFSRSPRPVPPSWACSTSHSSRTHGVEMYWGGILDHSLEPGRVYTELSAVAGALKRASGMLDGFAAQRRRRRPGLRGQVQRFLHNWS